MLALNRAVIAAVATALAVSPAAAQVPPQPVPRTVFIQTMDAQFRDMDGDKNNIVTIAEAEAFLNAAAVRAAQQHNVALFRQLDADRNGQVSPAEFAKLQVAAQRADASPILAQTDLNRDQRITLIEHRTGKLANFDRMDADKDGIVSVAEMKAAGLIK